MMAQEAYFTAFHCTSSMIPILLCLNALLRQSRFLFFLRELSNFLVGFHFKCVPFNCYAHIQVHAGNSINTIWVKQIPHLLKGAHINGGGGANSIHTFIYMPCQSH